MAADVHGFVVAVRSENKNVMADPRLADIMSIPKSMPLDGKRMRYGRFKNIVEA